MLSVLAWIAFHTVSSDDTQKTSSDVSCCSGVRKAAGSW